MALCGFETWRSLADNASGREDAADARWGQLRLWRDLDTGGISKAGDMGTLQAEGITDIAMAANFGFKRVDTVPARVKRMNPDALVDDERGALSRAALVLKPSVGPHIGCSEADCAIELPTARMTAEVGCA